MNRIDEYSLEEDYIKFVRLAQGELAFGKLALKSSHSAWKQHYENVISINQSARKILTQLDPDDNSPNIKKCHRLLNETDVLVRLALES